MILISTEILGLRELNGRFARYSDQLFLYRQQELQRFAPRFIAILKKNAPVGKTKKFSNSFHPRFGETRVATVVQFSSSDERAPYIIGPTRPHTIAAVRAKKLRFWVGGQKVFAYSVHHPGTKESDFVERSFIAGGDDFRRAMNKAGSRAIYYLAGKTGGEQ